MTKKKTIKTQEDKNNKHNKEAEKIKDIKKQLSIAQKSTKDNWEKFLVAQAEIENIKRRAIRNLEDANKYALDKFVKELLEVKDSLTIGLKLVRERNTKIEQIAEGLEITDKIFLSKMEKFGVKATGKIGEKFNPEIHEAITVIDDPKKESNIIIEVIQEGFLLNERIVRPAMVIVTK